MNDISIITQNEAIKTAFGSYAILDQFEVWEHPSIYKFAKIVSNYIAMQNKLDEIKNEQK